MRSVNFAVLGGMAEGLGKKGTSTDITLYDQKESDIIRTFVEPSGFPDKIQPLLQAIGMSEYIILHVERLDRFTGEQIVALDMLGRRIGVQSHSYEVDEGRLHDIIRGTAVEGYARMPRERIRDSISTMISESTGGPTRVMIDHCFDVKGAGTIVLGTVVSGIVSRHDTLILYPSGAQVVVRSVQMHDDPVDEAASPARVGLALRGVRPDGVRRGDILGAADSVNVSDDIGLDFAKTPYYREEMTEGQMCMLSVGLGVVAGRFLPGSPARVALERPIPYVDGAKGVILLPGSAGIRIAGGGRII